MSTRDTDGMLSDLELLREGMSVGYRTPQVETRGLDFKAKQIGTYTGSIEQFHGRCGFVGDCECLECHIVAAEDPLSKDRRAVLVVEDYGYPQLLLHVRWSSFTLDRVAG